MFKTVTVFLGSVAAGTFKKFTLDSILLHALQQALPALGDALLLYGGALRVPPLWLGELSAVLFLKLLRVIELASTQPPLAQREMISFEEGALCFALV